MLRHSNETVMRVNVVEGSIARFKADVIVNSTNTALWLDHGGLSKIISEAAGPELQAECSNNYPNGINFGELVVTLGHKLDCLKVYHVSVPHCESYIADSAMVLEQVISNCLVQAHTENMSSIAFPTLGCGYNGYPPAMVAEIAKNCIQTFATSNLGSSLNQVYFVVFPDAIKSKEMKKKFEEVFSSPCTDVRLTRSRLRKYEQDLSLKRAQDDAGNTCDKFLPCGHKCSGYKNEKSCPPCLNHGCSIFGRGQTINDDCVICYVDSLSEAPVIQLKCGHVFHLHCTKKVLEIGWNGARITFNFVLCPICKEPMEHAELTSLLEPFKALYDDVMGKAMMRLRYEGLENSDPITNPHSPYHNRPEMYAMERYCYYPCYKCKKPYFGGTAQCDDGAVADIKLEDLVCSPCKSGPQNAQNCEVHGTDYIEYKCRYCCSVARFYCFGTTHFCNECHNDHCRVVAMGKDNTLPKCPAGPCGKQLSGECPLGIEHAPNGDEHCLGCGLCKNLQTF